MAEKQPHKQKGIKEILILARDRALSGGLSGAAAMVIQVTTMMWLRTTMNYQYRYGTSTTEAMRHLYKDGGLIRFYRGYIPAIAQGPLSRFGDTAANAGMYELLSHFPETRDLSTAPKTFLASSGAACFRVLLMPIDTCKTMMQVQGKGALGKLAGKIRASGPIVLFHGGGAAIVGTLVGHFPWFYTYNSLQEMVPKQTELAPKLLRQAGIGFVSSVVSDTVSNSMRVLKTYRQANESKVSYPQIFRDIYKTDGLLGFFGRGLKTRILTNGLQGLVFSVLWKVFDDAWKKHKSDQAAAAH